MRHAETTELRIANERNFYKVELWTPDDHVERLIYAGNSLDKAREAFDSFLRRQPGARLTIRRRKLVLQQAPGLRRC